MTELELRRLYINKLTSWIGYSQSNGKHKQIIDIWNNHPQASRIYRMTYTDAWCACTVSAAAISIGITEIMPVECSCSRMITAYKKIGKWVENDSYIPNIGDLIMYDWDDNGVGDNTGNPEHVGAVVSVSNGTIKVIEGNKGNTHIVGYRDLKVNGKYIRGFCTPDFASMAKKYNANISSSNTTTATKNSVKVSVQVPIVKKGSTGNTVKALQQLLQLNGCNPKGIDGSCGPNTVEAIKSYQKKVGLTVDGSCGKDTWTKLLN